MYVCIYIFTVEFWSDQGMWDSVKLKIDKDNLGFWNLGKGQRLNDQTRSCDR